MQNCCPKCGMDYTKDIESGKVVNYCSTCGCNLKHPDHIDHNHLDHGCGCHCPHCGCSINYHQSMTCCPHCGKSFSGHHEEMMKKHMEHKKAMLEHLHETNPELEKKLVHIHDVALAKKQQYCTPEAKKIVVIIGGVAIAIIVGNIIASSQRKG